MSSLKQYLPYAYIRGKTVPFKDANISIATNSMQYGSALFGGIKGYKLDDGSFGIFRLDDHLDRLMNNAKSMHYPIKFSKNEIKQAILALARKNKPRQTTYFRPIIYRNDIALAPGIEGDYDFAVYMLYFDQYLGTSDGLKVQLSSWVRNSSNATPPTVKISGGYVNSALAIYDAKKAGYDTAILMNQAGTVGEAAVMNLFIAKNGVLITPDLKSDILEGITRKTVIELAKSSNVKLIEKTVTKEDLLSSDEVFLTGTATELAWVTCIDKTIISKNPGPIYNSLKKSFSTVTSSKNQYLTLVDYT